MNFDKLDCWMSVKFSRLQSILIDQDHTITLFLSAFYANYQLTVAIDVIGSICYLEAKTTFNHSLISKKTSRKIKIERKHSFAKQSQNDSGIRNHVTLVLVKQKYKTELQQEQSSIMAVYTNYLLKVDTNLKKHQKWLCRYFGFITKTFLRATKETMDS